MMFLNYFQLLFLITIFTLSSCATQKSPRMKNSVGEYKVSIESDGKIVENPNQSLIRRVRISSSDILASFGSAQRPKRPALHVSRAFDSRGHVSGLIITKDTPLSRSLGLKKGDILTAVGVKLTKTDNDLLNFGRLFTGKEELSFTYESAGEAKKTILYRIK